MLGEVPRLRSSRTEIGKLLRHSRFASLAAGEGFEPSVDLPGLAPEPTTSSPLWLQSAVTKKLFARDGRREAIACLSGGNPAPPPRDRLVQSVLERGFRAPSEGFPGAIDRQHRNRNVKRPARLPLDIKLFFQQNFD
jgi:hypothetical protein